MIKFDQFARWFNRDFWRAFKEGAFPICLPQTKEEKNELIVKVYSNIKSSRYAPSLPEVEIILNKGLGVARVVPVFSIEDYCVYYFCIKELEDILCGNRVDNTFGGWTLGGKIRKKEHCDIECEATDYGRYSFNPLAWTKAFGEFNSLLYAQLDTDNFSHVLQFDIANFYDTVRLDILERWIREDSPRDKGYIISLLFYFLNHWNRCNTQLEHQAVGLPQDALSDCSRILANYYLQKYDVYASQVCSEYDSLYFRYADDQMILLNDPSEIEGILLLLSRCLDKYGLRINQKKVHIWKNLELQKYRCRSLHSLFSEHGFKDIPERVRQFVDGYLAIEETDISNTWNRGIPLLNRLLWANLESLCPEILELVMKRLTSKTYLLNADCQRLERISKLNARRNRPCDFFGILENLGRESVHNAFHYEVLAFAESQKNLQLAEIFQQRISRLSSQMAGCKIK